MKRYFFAVLMACLCAFVTPAPASEIVRSRAALRAFAKAHACPSTKLHKLPCRGYVIDHIKPLDCGGKDAPANMQWQTIAAGHAKDKWERNGPGCKHRTKADKG